MAVGTGTTEKTGLEWTVRPSVTPDGPFINLHIEHPQHAARAWMPMSPEEAYDFAVALQRAADWCRDHV